MLMTKSNARVLVIGTRHEYQRHQDTMPAREAVRAELECRLREAIQDRKIDLFAEEAGDDKVVWEHLTRGEPVGEDAERMFGKGSATVDKPVPTIARILANEFAVRHEDVDVDARANEDDAES